MNGISLVNVTKSYNGILALRNLNLHVTPGEFIVVVGPSGSGKTTMLRCIAGLEEINSGDLLESTVGFIEETLRGEGQEDEFKTEVS